MRLGILRLAAVCTVILPAAAHAQVEASDALIGTVRNRTGETTPKSRLQANLGLGSPVGEIGASYTYAPLPEIQIELGTGLGYTGFQFSVMPKLALALNKSERFVVGAGPSASLDLATGPNHTYHGYWLHTEVGYEHRTASGFSLLVAAGITYGLGGEMRGQCSADCAGDTRTWNEPIAGKMFPQARIAFGRWF